MQVNYTAKKRKISLTALIDVVFILLMFFMLTTQFTQWQSIPLQLSQNASSTVQKEQVEALIIDQDGLITFTRPGQFDLTSNQSPLEQQKYFKDYTQADFSQIQLAPDLKLHPYSQANVKTVIEALDHFKSLGIKLSFGSQILESAKGSHHE